MPGRAHIPFPTRPATQVAHLSALTLFLEVAFGYMLGMDLEAKEIFVELSSYILSLILGLAVENNFYSEGSIDFNERLWLVVNLLPANCIFLGGKFVSGETMDEKRLIT